MSVAALSDGRLVHEELRGEPFAPAAGIRALRGRPPSRIGPRDALAWILGAGGLVWSAAILFSAASSASGAGLPLSLGAVAAWRYSWALLHLVRALIYLRIMFPRLRSRAAAVDAPRQVARIYGIVCSFNIPPAQFRAVYTALVANCLESGIPATIVSAVTSDRDCAILADVLRRFGDPKSVRIVVQFQKGDGKRSALASALRTIARERPDASSLTLLLDGDVVLDPGVLRESVRFLAADPSLTALTTNNDAHRATGGKARNWYLLRFAQRHVMMASLSLSRRLLVLTGRYAVYRTPFLVDPACIEALGNDHIDHWLHGRIRFLSGDDKSLWYQVLTRGGRMLYLPHVKAVSFEAMPEGAGFFSGSSQLMLRWLGNMVRANGRALALGPVRCGPFLWWCLADQRLAIVSTLFGLGVALCLLLTGHPAILLTYLAWLLVSRTVVASVYGLVWGRFHPSWPLFLVYNQIWGSLLKLHLFFRPDRQYWTRQHIARRSSTLVRRGLADLLAALATAFMIIIAAAAAGGL